uniref:Uncharacterized protein n=1 Tax=Picrophilus oshimae TaxID=46632 RepID=G5CCL3_9ARCH|nr:hypothetical protein [Picrophilus oshimae]AEP23075.1 hypothetical protein [Picrophilus oshimae]
MILTCHHCNHSWEYKGNSKYATCPKCHYKVMVSKSVSNVSEDVSNNISKSELKVSEKVSNSELKPQNVSKYVSGSELKVSNDIEERLRNLEEQVREIQNSLKLNIPIQRKPKGILIRCDKCGYEWYFTGLKKIARCPECNARVKVNESIVKDE